MGHLSPPVTLTSRLGGSTRHLHSTLLLFYIVRLWWAPKLGQTHLIILLWSVPGFLFHAFPPLCFRRVETWLSLTFDQGCWTCLVAMGYVCTLGCLHSEPGSSSSRWMNNRCSQTMSPPQEPLGQMQAVSLRTPPHTCHGTCTHRHTHVHICI